MTFGGISKFMKKIVELFLVLALTLGLVPATVTQAATGSTVSMKIDSIEGDVTVKNAKQVSKSAKAGTRLFNGDTITTGDDSYVYVLLDASKAVKIGENSEIKIENKNKKLELTVIAGALFFDVSKPLKKNETLNIRTSNMVCGVRGTIGVVGVDDKDSFVYILEGKVALTGEHIKNTDNVTVGAGEMVTVYDEPLDESQNLTYTNYVNRRKLKDKDIEAWVAKVIKNSKNLKKRVKVTKLNWSKIFKNAEKKKKSQPAYVWFYSDWNETAGDSWAYMTSSKPVVMPLAIYDEDGGIVKPMDVDVNVEITSISAERNHPKYSSQLIDESASSGGDKVEGLAEDLARVKSMIQGCYSYNPATGEITVTISADGFELIGPYPWGEEDYEVDGYLFGVKITISDMIAGSKGKTYEHTWNCRFGE